MEPGDEPPSSGPTIADTEPADGPRGRAPRLSLPGYELGQTIGAGGMGEVLLAHDPDIGRDVAIKRMRAAAPEPGEIARFLREARIQARLDHPAIVPVHELGRDASGLPYFTMKRLAGATLADVLAQPDAALPRLLRAFVDVCLAIEFAHARGVVHRDVKPQNIVLGDYGEVYVLDWGIARVVGDRAQESGTSSDIDTLDGKTAAGAILGTPGYMPPEQVRGDDDVGPPADVYALGCILFELLAREPLHPRGQGAIASTLDQPARSPAERAPARAIAPELDAACVAALAGDAAARPSARELADRIQRYLDGDRDLERRRTLAAEQLALASTAHRDPARRGDAMKLAARALALDPESKDAASLVGQLMLEPPRELPADLARHLARVDELDALRSARDGGLALLGFLGGIPLVLWTGVTDWTLFAVFYALVLVTSLVALRQWFRQSNNDIVPLFLNAATTIVLSRVLGPFVLVPAVLCTMMMALSASPQLLPRPWLVVTVATAAIGLPLVLEAIGVFAPTWEVTGGHITLTSPALHLGGTGTAGFLIISNLAIVIVATLFGRSIVARRREAQHEVEIQAWHLRQMLPETPATGSASA